MTSFFFPPERALLLGDPLVLDHVFRRLTHHAAAIVEALAPGAPGDLLEVAGAEDAHLLAVELAELGEDHGADGNVDAHAEGVGSADHLEQTALGELLDQQPVLRQKPGVMDADPVPDHPADLFAVGSVEAELADRLGDAALLVPARDLRAGERLTELCAVALGEVHDVDGCPVGLEQLLDRLVDGPLLVLEIQGHRPLVGVDVGDLAPAALVQLLLDGGGVAECGGHQQEGRVRQGQERNLPGAPSLAIAVVVEFVHHDVGSVAGLALSQCHVGEHLGGAADDRRRPVEADVAGQHSHVLRAEDVAEREELLAHQGLDGGGVERALSLAAPLEVEAERDQGLAGAGGRAQHHVAPGHQLEQRLLLGRVGHEARLAHPAEEAIQDRTGIADRRAQRHPSFEGNHPFLAAKSFMNCTRTSHPARGKAL